MTRLAPTALLNGMALMDAVDPHLAPGGHLRLFPHPSLGLPAAPIIVRRNQLDPSVLAQRARTDIIWETEDGQRLSAPFTLRPGMPVIGRLPVGSRCVWIEVEVSVGSQPLQPVLPVRPLRPIAAPIVVAPVRPLPVNDALLRRLNPGLSIAQLELTQHGHAEVQRRSSAPYALAGSHIRRIRLAGTGVVRGARWLDAGDLEKDAFYATEWRRWSLPVAPAPRYLAPADAVTAANSRVGRGAPLRRALPDAPDADPPAAPLIANRATRERQRVSKRWRDATAAGLSLESALKKLVSDVSAPAASLTSAVDSTDEISGATVGTITVNLLSAVQMALFDPGLARFVGLADVDEALAPGAAQAPPPGTLVLYWVDGWWPLPDTRKTALLALMMRALAGVDDARARAFEAVHKQPPPPDAGQLVPLTGIVPLLVGVPPDRPLPPRVAALRSGPWHSQVMPPAALREVVLPVADLLPGAQLAFARLAGAVPHSLHEKAADGSALPLIAGELPDASAAGQGELFDREAPADATRYRVAQADWFGRWSTWRQATAPAATRPAPPTPVAELHYAQPAVVGEGPDGNLAGRVTIRVPVPTLATLAPGSRAIKGLDYELNGTAASVELTNGQTLVEAALAGPGLARGGQGLVRLVARWRDTAGVQSQPCPGVERRIHDPRPPKQLTRPETLAMASRADVAGKSRVRLNWTPADGQATTRVFQSDETTLRRRLEKLGGHATLLAELAAAAPPRRAELLVQNKHLFGREAFAEISPDSFAGRSLEHQLSGSLRVLVFYRIVPVSAAGVEADFAGTAMLPFAVPNDGPPATPQLAVTLVRDGGVLLPSVAISVPRGAVPAHAYRLRRSPSESRDALRMGVVHTGTVPPLPPGAGLEARQEVPSFVDRGGSLPPFNVPLLAWNRYSWAVEVQAPPPPGSNLAGEWSAPSAVVTLAIVPDAAPVAPGDGRIDNDPQSGGVRISFNHPDTLEGGGLGSHAIDLYRALPGEAMQHFSSLLPDAPADAGGRVADLAGGWRFGWLLPAAPVPGTRFMAMVIDPAGRSSPPSAILVVP